MREACNKTVAWAEQTWLRRRQGIKRLLIDDVAEQYKHVESQNASTDRIEGCSGGRCSWENEERKFLGARAVYLVTLLLLLG